MIARFRHTCRDNAGFTLIEIVVATAVGTMIMLMIYSANRAIMFSIKDLTGVAEFHENINLSVRQMERDISCTVINPNNKNIQFKGENQFGQNSNGRLRFVTVNRHSFTMLGDVTSEVHQTDVKEVQYYLKPDPKYPGLFLMMRSEKNLYDTHNEDGSVDAVAPETESLLLENITDLKFEFAADRSFDDRWNETAPPKAVRTTIRMKNYRGKDEVITFVSALHRARQGS